MTHLDWKNVIEPMIAELWPKADLNPAAMSVWKDKLGESQVEVVKRALQEAFASSRFATPRLADVLQHLREVRPSQDAEAEPLGRWHAARISFERAWPHLSSDINAMDDEQFEVVYLHWQAEKFTELYGRDHPAAVKYYELAMQLEQRLGNRAPLVRAPVEARR